MRSVEGVESLATAPCAYGAAVAHEVKMLLDAFLLAPVLSDFNQSAKRKPVCLPR